MTNVNKVYSKLVCKGEVRITNHKLYYDILIKKNPKGGYVAYWLDMYYCRCDGKDYLKSSQIREFLNNHLTA